MRRLLLFAALGPALAATGCSEEIVFSDDDPWRDPTSYPDPARGLVFVTNSYDDTITWLDYDTLAPIFTQPVGRLPPEREGPHHGAALPDGTAYFVGLSNYVPGSGTGPHGSHGTGAVDGYLLKYRLPDHVLVGEVRVGRNPGDVRITRDGRYVLQSHFDLLKILEHADSGDLEKMRAPLAVVDAEAMERVALVDVCVTPHGIGVDPRRDVVWLACYGSDELAAVTLAPPWTVERFPVGPGVVNPMQPTYGPYAVAVSPADGRVWVSCLSSRDLRVFDPETRTWDARGPVPLGGAPFFGDFLDDGARFVVPSQGDNALVFVDTATLAPSTMPLPDEACAPLYGPHAAVLHPSGDKLIVVCEGDHTTPGSSSVAVVDLRSAPSVTTYHRVGLFPDDAVVIRPRP